MDKKKLEKPRPDIEYTNDPIVMPSTTRGLEAADLFDGARIMLRMHPGERARKWPEQNRPARQPGEPWDSSI